MNTKLDFIILSRSPSFTLIIAMICIQISCSTPEPIEFTQVNSGLTDDDRDGVINIRDECLDSPPRALVDENGCEHWLDDDGFKETIIFFDFNSDIVKASQQAALNKLAKYLSQNQDIYAVIEGHTSDVGQDDYNQKLSLRRAQSVMNFLVNKDIHSNRIYIENQGDHSERLNEISNEKSQIHNINQRVYIMTYRLEKKVQEKWDVFDDSIEIKS